MPSDITADVTTTPEYHALFEAFESAQADWDDLRPDGWARDTEPEDLSSAEHDRFERYRDAVAELNGYRLRKGLGPL